MNTLQMKWALNGYYNQKYKSYCPMCGQKIIDEGAIHFFKGLASLSRQKSNEKAQLIISNIRRYVESIGTINIKDNIAKFNEIISGLNDAGLLLKKEADCIITGLQWQDEHNELLQSIMDKLYKKIDNPYNEISLTKGEKNCLGILNKISNSVERLGSIIDAVSERLNKKTSKAETNSRLSALYEVSFGTNRLEIEEMILNAKRVEAILDDIDRINVSLDDLFNGIKVKEVNKYLKELNVNFSIIIEKKRYYIKIGNYMKQSYNKSKDNILCSEGEQRALAFAYFLSEVLDTEIQNENKTIVIDDPICSLDLCRKSVISYWISELMKDEKNQSFILSHDVTFIERIFNFFDNKYDVLNMLEMVDSSTLFKELILDDYLMTDEKVYSDLLTTAMLTHKNEDVIMGLMSLRPYAYVKKISKDDFYKVISKSTYFAHTLYSYNKDIKFTKKEYGNKGIKEYVTLVNELTGSAFYVDQTLDEFEFNGFDFTSVTKLYQSIPLNSIKDARKKSLLLRPVLESCLYQLVNNKKFDPDHISTAYTKAINGAHGEKKEMCLKLKELYDSTKKYHHGADDGSTLGISWINPKEIEYYDKEINKIIHYINDVGAIREISA